MARQRQPISLMKRQQRFHFCRAAILLLLLPHPTQAADWWAASDPFDQVAVYSDIDSLQRADGICSITEVVVHGLAKQGRDKSQSLKIQYDCGRLLSRDQTSGMTRNGGEAGVGRIRSQEWQAISPNSMNEALLSFACTFTLKREVDVSPNVIDADGREFKRVTRPNLAVRALRQSEHDAERLPSAPSGDVLTASGIKDDRNSPAQSAIRAQVSASPTLATANKMVDLLRGKGLLGPSIIAHIEPAVVSGHKVYRVIVGDLVTLESARQFCANVVGSGFACFIRTRH